ncbi:MAG TPA: GNAT family N-acetyltransferase [Thermomicrobiales bacterium]|nr:GNAT family N-acetyltransferase [Thermomicrobiales bacterium]
MTSRDANEHATNDNSADFTIENARFGDLRAVAAIQKASFRPVLAYGMFPLTTLHLLPFVTFLVARDTVTNDVVGCIIGDRHRGDVRIMNIAVHPDWRRHGIGRALLHAIADRLPGGNIVLMAEESNYGAIALYESEGFVRTGRQRDYYGPRRHGIEMTLRRERPPQTHDGKPTSGRLRV